MKGARALSREVRQVLGESGMESSVYGTTMFGGEIEMARWVWEGAAQS